MLIKSTVKVTELSSILHLVTSDNQNIMKYFVKCLPIILIQFTKEIKTFLRIQYDTKASCTVQKSILIFRNHIVFKMLTDSSLEVCCGDLNSSTVNAYPLPINFKPHSCIFILLFPIEDRNTLLKKY